MQIGLETLENERVGEKSVSNFRHFRDFWQRTPKFSFKCKILAGKTKRGTGTEPVPRFNILAAGMHRVQSGCLSFFDHIHDRFESVRVIERQVGQSLAVKTDTFLSQHVDEAAVIEPFGTGGCIDARNPEAAENAFFEFAVTEGVLPTFFQGVFRYGVHFRTGAEVTAGSEHDFFPAGTAGRIVGCSWHECNFLVRSRDQRRANPPGCGSFSEILVKKMCLNVPAFGNGDSDHQQALQTCVVGIVRHHGIAQVALGFRRLFTHQVAHSGPVALYFPCTSHLETLLGAGMGLHFRHDKNAVC